MYVCVRQAFFVLVVVSRAPFFDNLNVVDNTLDYCIIQCVCVLDSRHEHKSVCWPH